METFEKYILTITDNGKKDIVFNKPLQNPFIFGELFSGLIVVDYTTILVCTLDTMGYMVFSWNVFVDKEKEVIKQYVERGEFTLKEDYFKLTENK